LNPESLTGLQLLRLDDNLVVSPGVLSSFLFALKCLVVEKLEGLQIDLKSFQKEEK
jgi:hypothetical protein